MHAVVSVCMCHAAYDKDGARLYVLAPMDMIVVQKRTADDHVGWLLEHEKYEAALTLCEESARELKAYSTEVCLWEEGSGVVWEGGSGVVWD